MIRSKCRNLDRRIVVGIGDDAAVIKTSPHRLGVLTTDALIETVHFNLDYFSFYQLGWRSLAANLSDVAAMGGKPIASLVTLGLNNRVSVEEVLEFYQGMLALAEKFNCSIAGGDIVRSPQELVVSISVLGEVEPKKIAKRSGAKIGDLICVTGALGEAQVGLELLLRRRKNKRFKFPVHLTRKHLVPLPRLAESSFLTSNFEISSMIDISDGLASDLYHICEESKTGARIFADQIPLGPRAIYGARLLEKDPLQFALYGGEEYELLFTLSPSQAKRAIFRAKFKITPIGEVASSREGIFLHKKGRQQRLLPKGYTHF